VLYNCRLFGGSVYSAAKVLEEEKVILIEGEVK
jgi:hypothetical protein